jgi:methionyl aminopeptidase
MADSASSSDADDAPSLGGADDAAAAAARLAANRKKRDKKKAAAARKKAAGDAAAAGAGAGAAAGGATSGGATAAAPGGGLAGSTSAASDLPAGVVAPGRPLGVPSRSRDGQRVIGGACDASVAVGQTYPPTLPVASLYVGGRCPVGEELPHAGEGGTARTTSAELRAADRARHGDVLGALREAGEVHRQVRQYAQSIIRPGIRLADMCEAIEDANRRLVGEAGLARGIAFPTGCSINHVAAHYTPNPGDDTVLKYGDVMKVDFGTQIGGRIVDCAWTVAFDPTYDGLLEAVKAATEAGIRAAGVDVRLGDIGAAIQEVMESHEVTLGSTTHTVRSIRNLNGHSIDPYRIHAGKSVPIVRSSDQTKMEEGEHFAIETFGSIAGRAYVVEEGDCSHFMRSWDGAARAPVTLPRARALLKDIDKTFSTLAFCPRWLERPDGGSATVNCGRQEKYIGALNNLCTLGYVNKYPPLVEARGAFTAQYE